MSFPTRPAEPVSVRPAIYICQSTQMNKLTFTDQLNEPIYLNAPPKRIISLVPSQTELLYDLGLETEVIGLTKFCIHPERWFKTKTKIGGTKTPKIQAILDLEPDLIIANKEENRKEDVEELKKHIPVWVSDVKDLETALNMIQGVGAVIGRARESDILSEKIQRSFAEFVNQKTTLDQQIKQLKTAYFIWKDPWMTVGQDTFIHNMLETIGLQNIYADQTRYPITTIQELQEKQVELLFLSSEPYPFKEKHIVELQAQLPDTTILLVDGELFSWYGSRLQYAPAYFKKILTNLVDFNTP